MQGPEQWRAGYHFGTGGPCLAQPALMQGGDVDILRILLVSCRPDLFAAKHRHPRNCLCSANLVQPVGGRHQLLVLFHTSGIGDIEQSTLGKQRLRKQRPVSALEQRRTGTAQRPYRGVSVVADEDSRRASR
jgi:hypothetical protein